MAPDYNPLRFRETQEERPCSAAFQSSSLHS